MTVRLDAGWEGEQSPFHRGEREIQERLGMRNALERQGRAVIRRYLPEQHREFYTALPFIAVGTVDDHGQPWATLLGTGRPFIDSPDDQHLLIHAAPGPDDPAAAGLRVGRPAGILGIEFATRRRNRVNGRIVAADGALSFRVDQAFGNCPMYIQSRDFRVTLDPPGAAVAGRSLDDRARAMVAAADTFFVATAHPDLDRDGPNQGVDVSHRGGRPGFVRVDDAHTLTWPDYVGNFHFNTLGNIRLNPRSGLVFVDFETGDLLHLAGRAEIIWDGAEVEAFEGAERLVRYRIDEAVRIPGGFPLRWTFNEYAPELERTGTWAGARERLSAREQARTFQPLEVVGVQPESDTITSIHLRPQSGEPISWTAGQHLPLRICVGCEARYRNYTISAAPGTDAYRISVKREADGQVSPLLHQLQVGDTLEARGPAGRFVLDDSHRPVVFLSAGVGITPMIAMLEDLVRRNSRGRGLRRAWFIHGARNGAEQAFGDRLAELAGAHDWLTVHVRHSAPCPGEDPDSTGRVNLELVRQLLALDDYEFYLCGPEGFMRALYTGLGALGIRRERVHYEFFGAGEPLEAEELRPTVDPADLEPAQVTFARSGRTARWEPATGSLLDLAEQAGIAAPFGCRTGICSTCTTPVLDGEVAYEQRPATPLEGGQALICRALPAGPVKLDL